MKRAYGRFELGSLHPAGRRLVAGFGHAPAAVALYEVVRDA